jgi:hypothetical protein
MRFDEYTPHDSEYPRPAVEPLKPGVFWSYISSTFLNGWINYTGDAVRAYLMERYYSPERNDETNAESLARWHADPPFHSKLGELGDDVILVTKDEGGKWWVYWFDCDVSDCCIGILDTADDDAAVLAAFDEWIAVRQVDLRPEGKALPIEPKSIRGWVSF